jgi:hypothetical protein
MTLTTPLIKKYNSDTALYDSLGDIKQSYISLIQEENFIYFLKDTSGTVHRYNTITEELSVLTLKYTNGMLVGMPKINPDGTITYPTQKDYLVMPLDYGDDALIPLGLQDNLQNGQIPSETILNNYIPAKIVYANNETQNVYSILKYKGSIYGFEGYNTKKFVDDTVLYIKNNNQLVQESFDRKINIVHLSSATQIRDFIIDDQYNYYVIHNKNKITKFDKNRILNYSFNLSASTDSLFNQLLVMPDNIIELLKIDFVREYTNNGLDMYPIVLGKISNTTSFLSANQLFLAKIDETTKTVTRLEFLSLTGNYIPYGNVNKVNYNLTNYEYLKNKYPLKKEIIFKLILQNVYNNKDKIKVEIPIATDKFQSEYHHFAFKLDGLEGTVSLFVDGTKYKTIHIQKGQYVFQDIFGETINIGNTYFHNNISLGKHLNQPNYYYINNAKIKQFKIYKKALTDNEILFHTYHGLNMDDLVLSLPCDQRNEIDGIERQFKLDTTGNKSNKVNVIIRNSKLTNTTLKNQMKEVLLEKLKKVLPITTSINNIEFK